MSFTDKVVIVTGGSAGIGAAIVVEFARKGAKVVIVGRNEENLKKEAEKCKALNGDCHVVKADVTNENDANRIVDETIKKYGKIDILVNNAGIVGHGRVLDGTIRKNYDAIMNTNLKSVVVLTSLAAPYLIKTKGNIINISSIAGSRVTSPERMVYSLSKAAVNMFTTGAALELAPHGVRVNTVSPGPVRTDILNTCGIDVNIEDLRHGAALGRIGDPKEIADLVLFVASDKAKGITGSNYINDNGCMIYREQR